MLYISVTLTFILCKISLDFSSEIGGRLEDEQRFIMRSKSWKNGWELREGSVLTDFSCEMLWYKPSGTSLPI